MSAKQNDKQDAVRSPETSFSMPIEEMELTNHAVRSPESTRDAVRSRKTSFISNQPEHED